MMNDIVMYGCMLLCGKELPVESESNWSESAIVTDPVQGVAGWSSTATLVLLVALVAVEPFP